MSQSVQQETTPSPGRKRELLAIVLMAFSVLIIVSLHSTASGAVGALISRILRAAFGASAEIPALFLFVVGISTLSRSPRLGRGRRIFSIALMYAVLLCAYHLFVLYRESPVSSFWAVNLGKSHKGGGQVGGFLLSLLLTAFGSWGSVVVLIALFFIGLTLFVDRSMTGVSSSSVDRVGRVLTRTGQGIWGFTVGVKDEMVELTGLIADKWSRRKEERAVQSVRKQRRPDAPAANEKDPSVGSSGHNTRRGRVGQSDTNNETDQTTNDDQPEGTHASASRASKTPPATSSTGGRRAQQTDARSDPSSGTNNKVSASDDSDEFEPEQLPLSETYRLPQPSLLDRPRAGSKGKRSEDTDQSKLLEDTLATFGVEAKVVDVSRGPVVTRYELQPAPGVKVSRIVNLADDVSLNLAAAGVRIEAPVPGKSVVGIEVPNKETGMVHFREVVESDEFMNHPSKIIAALGKDIAGKPVIADMTKLLHLLIAGATGSGKSVCINTLICSILFKARPDEVKLLMIDPKRVELAIYEGIPHLISPVVTDPKLAANALRWAVKEMEDRYKKFSEHKVRNILGYNQAIERGKIEDEPMPYIAVIIDELADLMLVAGNEVEDSICRLAQMARAAGIHLVIATQRPSVDVITGLIKANVPSRLSFAVSSGTDSRTILDMMGAERLIGKGDMLFYPIGENKPLRAQGAFISDREVQKVVEACKQQAEPEFKETVTEVESPVALVEESDDELFDDAVRLVIDVGNASISMIQRRFRVGYARAARLIDMMELAGIVGPYQGSKPREVLKSMDDLEEVVNE